MRFDPLHRLPKTVIIGASGFLGKAFLSYYRQSHSDCLGTVRYPVFEDNHHMGYLDMLSPNITPLRLAETGHKHALIFASVAKLKTCEQEREKTWNINVAGTLKLVDQLAEAGIRSIFASSDVVFDGSRGHYRDDAQPSPVNEYGRQKAEIEAKLNEVSRGNYLVIRLSKVFSLEKGDNTLLDEMAMTFAAGKKVQAAYDQVFCPILISDLIQVVTILQSKDLTGVVNVCGSEEWSRYDMAVAMAKSMNMAPTRVEKVSIDDLDLGCRRPKNTTMRIDRLRRETGFHFTPIIDYIHSVAKNWQSWQG